MSNTDIKQKLTLVHLYPQEMNIYGDMGNIITLKQRCLWRGIDFEIVNVNLDDDGKIPDGDIYFMGGGQDNDMYKVFNDLYTHMRDQILEKVENNKVFLLICGGLQLFGEYFLDANLREIKGLGILPITTKAPGSALKQRCLGNIVTKLSDEMSEKVKKYYPNDFSPYLIGFENHSGQTYFTSNKAVPLSNSISGYGNNSTEKTEGANIKNIYASYMHGSLLPKNPHFADMLIGRALENKYGEIELSNLDDRIEWAAHKALLEKLQITPQRKLST